MGSISEALIELRQGKVVAFPSEGVWGLGCDPINKHAVKELLRLKKRPPEKGLILVGSSLGQFEPYIDIKKYKSKLMTKWPGAHTWAVPTRTTPPWVTGQYSTVAVRVSKHAVIKSICRSFGGVLISSSANVKGETPARSKEEVQKIFKDIIIVDGSLGSHKGSTPIQDIETDEWIRRPE